MYSVSYIVYCWSLLFSEWYDLEVWIAGWILVYFYVDVSVTTCVSCCCICGYRSVSGVFCAVHIYLEGSVCHRSGAVIFVGDC